MHRRTSLLAQALLAAALTSSCTAGAPAFADTTAETGLWVSETQQTSFDRRWDIASGLTSKDDGDRPGTTASAQDASLASGRTEGGSGPSSTLTTSPTTTTTPAASTGSGLTTPTGATDQTTTLPLSQTGDPTSQGVITCALAAGGITLALGIRTRLDRSRRPTPRHLMGGQR